MGSNAGVILLIIGILVLLAGLGMPSEQTVTSRTCTEGSWVGGVYVEGNCYEGAVSSPNPAKGATTGFGFILTVVGGIAALAGTTGESRRSDRNTGGIPDSPGTASPTYTLEITGTVIDAETSEETTLSMRVRSDDADRAAETFKETALDEGHVLKGDPDVEVVSVADSPASSAVSEGEETDAETSSPQSGTPVTELAVDRLETVDDRMWDRIVKAGVGAWIASVLVPGWLIPFDAVFALALFGTWISLPVALYMDSRRVARETEWRPRGAAMSLVALVPIVNAVVGSGYLIRRRYALDGREFSLEILFEDCRRRLEGIVSALSERR